MEERGHRRPDPAATMDDGRDDEDDGRDDDDRDDDEDNDDRAVAGNANGQ
jgi:hypothetical protein